MRAPGIAAFPRGTGIPQGSQNISILVAICPPEISVYSRYELVFSAYNVSVYTQNCLTYNMPYSLLWYTVQHQVWSRNSPAAKKSMVTNSYSWNWLVCLITYPNSRKFLTCWDGVCYSLQSNISFPMEHGMCVKLGRNHFCVAASSTDGIHRKGS